MNRSTKNSAQLITVMNGSPIARSYNEGLGAVPPAGSRGRAPGHGWSDAPPKAECNLAINVFVVFAFPVLLRAS